MAHAKHTTPNTISFANLILYALPIIDAVTLKANLMSYAAFACITNIWSKYKGALIKVLFSVTQTEILDYFNILLIISNLSVIVSFNRQWRPALKGNTRGEFVSTLNFK